MAVSKPAPVAKEKPPTLFKTEVLEGIDRASQDPALLRRALDALREGVPLLEIGTRTDTVRGDDDRRAHLDAHWLGDEHDRGVLTRALIRAGELALEHGVPIDAYWVFAGSRREIGVSFNERQVTLLIVTPFPDIPTQGEAQPHPRIEIFS